MIKINVCQRCKIEKQVIFLIKVRSKYRGMLEFENLENTTIFGKSGLNESICNSKIGPRNKCNLSACHNRCKEGVASYYVLKPYMLQKVAQ